MDKEKMNNDPQNTSEEITERIEEMIEEETETGAGTVSISDRLREAEADENDYDADVEDGYDEAEYDEADGEVDSENEYGEASEDAEYVEDEYSEEEEEEDDDDEPRIVVNPKVVKVASLILFSGIILVFASIAWFTMNRDVGTSGMSVTTTTLPFELKTIGEIAPNSSLIEEYGYYSGTPVTSGTTTEGAGEIKWLLQPDDDMAKDGLRPGTKGSLRFVVVPKDVDASKDLIVSYTLKLTAYKLTDQMKEDIAEANEHRMNGEEDYPMPTITKDDLIELSDNPSDSNYTKGIDFINGHILFFKNADNTGRFRLGETQTITFNTTEEKEIPIHWVWPETIGNMVLTGNNVVNVCTGEEKTALVTFIKDNPSLLFDPSDLDSDMLSEGKLKDNVLGDDLTDYYPVLNLAYNNADQVIGVNVQYFMIELLVEGQLVDAED